VIFLSNSPNKKIDTHANSNSHIEKPSWIYYIQMIVQQNHFYFRQLRLEITLDCSQIDMTSTNFVTWNNLCLILVDSRKSGKSFKSFFGLIDKNMNGSGAQSPVQKRYIIKHIFRAQSNWLSTLLLCQKR